MNHSQLHWIANFIWGIADDVLRDLYVRGKYRDVILPMTVLRRLDSLLEASKPAVLEMKTALDTATIIHQDQALRQAAGQAFYTPRRSRCATLRPDRQNARIEHDEALRRVMTAVLNDDMQLFKQFSDNESFRRCLTDAIFSLTYEAT